MLPPVRLAYLKGTPTPPKSPVQRPSCLLSPKLATMLNFTADFQSLISALAPDLKVYNEALPSEYYIIIINLTSQAEEEMPNTQSTELQISEDVSMYQTIHFFRNTVLVNRMIGTFFKKFYIYSDRESN